MACEDCPPAAEESVHDAVRWKAWYVGGQAFESESTEWADLPPRGFLGAVVWFRNDRNRRISGDTWYWLHDEDGRWTIAHSSDPMEELLDIYGERPYKRGQWVTDAEMQAVNQAIREASR